MCSVPWEEKKKEAILRLCASIHYHIPNLRTPAQLKKHSRSIVLFVLLTELLRDPVSCMVSPCALHMAAKFLAEGRSPAHQVHVPLFVIATEGKIVSSQTISTQNGVVSRCACV